MSDGDRFDFSFVRLRGVESEAAQPFGLGGEVLTEIKEGDEFSLLVKNATATLQDDGNRTLLVDWIFESETTELNVSLEFGNPITYTNWDYWSEEVNKVLLDVFLLTNGSITYEVENGLETFKSVFSADGEIEFLGKTSTILLTLELHYDKATGVISLFAFLMEIINEKGKSEALEYAWLKMDMQTLSCHLDPFLRKLGKMQHCLDLTYFLVSPLLWQ